MNSARLFSSHVELASVLRARVAPLTVRYFSERQNFPTIVRAARILLLLLKRHMTLLTNECEMILSLLTHILELNGVESWKRLFCMEIFRGLYAEPAVIRLIYCLYDAQEGRKDILKDHMASLVRLACEKPSLIGLSNQSTTPFRADHSRSMTEEQITLETGGVAGMIGTTNPPVEMDVPGIGEWSVVRSPYIELLDKAEPPTPPDTYIYSIILNCIAAFSEGLAKFILPLTVPELKHKRKSRVNAQDAPELQRSDSFKGTTSLATRKSPIPINPLELEGHPQYPAIRASAGILDDCWPAILATCSTFLYAALNDEFYHTLVRSFQKLTHVAGLLRLSVPRDAFLTTLGKAAMPIDNSGSKSASAAGSEALNAAERKRKASDVPTSRTPQASETTSGSYFESPSVSLNTRNLLCLRALLNLGIALGPTLDQPAWGIILETLRDADLMVGMSSMAMARPAPTNSSPVDAVPSPGFDAPKANLGTEIVAARAASTKMFESTSDYPSNSFQDILSALLNLSGSTGVVAQYLSSDMSSQRAPDRLHQGSHRMSLAIGKARMQEEELRFVLERTEELAGANLKRLSSLQESEHRTWQLLTDSLIASTANGDVNSELRLSASRIVNNIIYRTMVPDGGNNNTSALNELQLRNLRALQVQINSLYDAKPNSSKSPAALVVEIHERALEVLRNILEQYAETFTDAWDLIFGLISSIFSVSRNDGKRVSGSEAKQPTDSPRLVRAAYRCLQLVASDFLSLLPSSCLLTLINTFSNFASQKQDFNISLTTTSFFWKISDFIEGQIEQFSIENDIDAFVSEEELERLVKDNNVSASHNSLWLLLLLRIVNVTTDSRPEVRNSAIRTLLRIFDSYGQQLSPKGWYLCLNRVLFGMVEDVEAKLVRATSSDKTSDEAKSWVDTAVVVVKGCSDLVTNFFETIVRDEGFDRSWARLLDYFERLIGLRSLEFVEATFSSLSDMLLRSETPCNLSPTALHAAWSLWAGGYPALYEDSLDLESPNQDAALAYLKAFEQIYRLYKDQLTEVHIDKVLRHMQLLVWNSVSSRYSPDTDRPSAVQALVVDCVKIIIMEKHTSQPRILVCLAEFAESAISKGSADADPRRPTFVAFSKRIIELLDWYISQFGIKRDIFSNGSLMTALERLSTPITQKYSWTGKEREPLLWRKATTASLDVLQVAIPYVERQYGNVGNEAEISLFWRCVVVIARGIVSAEGHRTTQLSTPDILADEAFDTAAFNRLKSLIVPSLGAPSIPDSVRREFAMALFDSSFVYPPQGSELPRRASIETKPLSDLYRIRPGRTFDPPPTLRGKMAYVLMDSMFDLACIPRNDETTALHTSSKSPRLLLARSISPYLILRCAISLKSYIADQPLRGLMPQPTPARDALLHLLNRMIELRSEPSAVPEPAGFISMSLSSSSSTEPIDSHHGKKHLEWMYPLTVKALQVAGRERDDGRVLQVLGRILEALESQTL